MPYKDPAAKRANQKARFQGRREDFIQSRGGKCELDGSTDRLEVDHIDQALKTMDPREIWKMNPADPRAIKELTNCRVLCHTCHIARSAQQTRERAEARRSGLEKLESRRPHKSETTGAEPVPASNVVTDTVSEETCVT